MFYFFGAAILQLFINDIILLNLCYSYVKICMICIFHMILSESPRNRHFCVSNGSKIYNDYLKTKCWTFQ